MYMFRVFMLLTITFLISITINKADEKKPPADSQTGPVITEKKELNKVFKKSGFNGCILIYDMNKKEYISNNPGRCSQRFSPASTFKIPNSLIGLETGVIKDENFVIRWDGTKKYFKKWEQDHDLKLALRNSTVWYYQELARRVGEEEMKKHIEAISYGNMDISDGIDRFWLTGCLKISAREQVEFLKKLYSNELPFSQRSMDIVKKIMVVDKREAYTMRAKTGGADKIGWYVGWVEKGGNVYFFATNIDKNGGYTPEFFKARIAITRDILMQLNIL